MNTIHAGGVILALLAGLGGVSTALAQKTYRCGNTYQSYPCALTPGAAGAAKTDAKVEEKPKPAAAVPKPVEVVTLTPEQQAAKDKKERCDKIYNDMNYNSAQQKAAVSNTTMERLKGERKQIDADMKKEACPPAS